MNLMWTSPIKGEKKPYNYLEIVKNIMQTKLSPAGELWLQKTHLQPPVKESRSFFLRAELKWFLIKNRENLEN